MKRYIFKITWLAIFAWLASASAQNLLQPHPLDLRSGQAHLLNPSIMSYQDNLIQLGMRFYHLGFIDGSATRFRLNYFSVVVPRWLPAELALAAHGQTLSLPLYNQSYLSVAVSRRYQRRFAVGLQAGLLSKSYDRGEFNLVDPDDPVFRNQTGFTRFDLGAGVTYWPLPMLSIALSRDHLNRPNLALGAQGFQLPGETHLALAYHFGNMQAAFIAQRSDQGFRPGGFVEMTDPDRGFLRLGFDNLGVQMEGRLLLYGPMSLNYSFNYPTADLRGETSGSHEIAFVFEFDRLSKMPKIEEAPAFRYSFTAPPTSAASAPRVFLRAESDGLEIIAKRLRRIIAPDVPAHALSALSNSDLGGMDSAFVATTLPIEFAPISNGDSSATLSGLYSRTYWHSLRQLSESLTRLPVHQTTIVTNPFSQRRAMELRNYLQQSGPDTIQLGQPYFASRLDSLRFSRRAYNRIIVPKEEVLVLNPQAAIFHIATANFSLPPGRWQLTVEKEFGGAVWKMEGKGRLPEQLVWNWRDNNGKLIVPGYYRYFISWQTTDGVAFKSPSRQFYVKKFQRTITINVSRKFDGLQQPADEVRMILNR
jgi:hypothetical protein